MFNFMRLPPLRRLMLMKAITGGGSWSTISGNPVSFTAKAAHLRQLSVAFSPVQEGTGDPSPDNVRPISGWDSLHVYDDPLYAGVIEWNQLFNYVGVSPPQAQGVTCINNNNGTFTCDGVSTSRVYKLLVTLATIVGHKYYLGGCPSGGDITKYLINIDAVTGSVDTGSGAIFTSTRASSKLYIVIGKDYPVSNLVFTPQLCDLTEMFGAGNEPTTVAEFRELFPLDYYAYNAGTETLVGTVNGLDTRSISITLGQTVYGGTVTFNQDGTADLAIAYKGVKGSELTWTEQTTFGGTYRATLTNLNSTGSIPVYCDSMKVCPSGAELTAAVAGIYAKNNGDYCYAKNTLADDFVAWVADVTIVYPFNRPVTYHIDPQEVSSLLGENVLFSDANGDLTVEYRSN